MDGIEDSRVADPPRRKGRQTYDPSGGVPKRLHSLMLKRGLTRMEFTHRLNEVKDAATEVHGRHRVNAWLRGTTMPSRTAWADTAGVLGVAEQELIAPFDAVLVGGHADGMRETAERLSDGRVRDSFSACLSAEKHHKVLSITHGNDA